MIIIARVPKSPRSMWEAKKSGLKKKFPQLSTDDLNFDESHKKEMLKHLHVVLGKTIRELQDILEAL